LDIQQREEHAKRLLNDELLQEAFDTLREELMNRWSHSGSTDLEARESIWLAIRLLEKIDGHLKSIVETGHMAKMMEKQHPYI
jgi:ribosomal protein S18 acetylase RimI-like enzyme|tara:strand:- start:9 stop:257 length:249 start_codon:yes stop_codon:yes gene_type:complete